MQVCLVAGSHISESLLPVIEKADVLVGIDGGTRFLLEHNFVPAVAVGDFDSVSDAQKATFAKKIPEIITLPAEKDDTDTQMALLWAVRHHPQANFILLGATGGRLDHFLANLFLPFEERFAPFIRQITLLDEQNCVTFFAPGNYEVKHDDSYKYVAFVPLTPVNQFTIHGAKYNLAATDVPTPFSYASNEFLPAKTPIHFAFKTGRVAVIYSRDRAVASTTK